MEFIADIHLHSHFSRATARNLDLEHLYQAAKLKGVTLVGTGDFTHPGWLKELGEKLEPCEPGLYRLKRSIAEELDRCLPESCRSGTVRFILQCEISSIYKRDGRVRKNHNLVYLPDLETVKIFNATLDRIGNLKSDGRPILGLDAQRLLEIVLDTSDESFLIPAHIWTPWFSMFGSKSGFDSIDECFGDLSSHIFAAETGLSSDPPMNWRIKDLDHITLISNSDAHSPMYLGRNASRFNSDLSFPGVRRALANKDDTFVGTIDMFPEEGKYHYDGHRKCNVCLEPGKTSALGGICPKCKRPLTLGVLYRVHELASRPSGYNPGDRRPFESIIPLADILSEIFDVGPKTKKVATHYDLALKRLGPELEILLTMPGSEIETAGVPLLKEAVLRMRRGEVSISPGFDGEYGRVKIFEPEEKQRLRGEMEMFGQDLRSSSKSVSKTVKKKRPVSGKKNEKNVPGEKMRSFKKTETLKKPGNSSKSACLEVKKHLKGRGSLAQANPKSVAGPLKDGAMDIVHSLNKEQRLALKGVGHPLLIEAGPGTGKTRTLTARIVWLIRERGVEPGTILALTFTNRAADEMQERLDALLPEGKSTVWAGTFHRFCLMVLKEYTGFKRFIVDDGAKKEMLKQAVAHAGVDLSQKPGFFSLADRTISMAKQHCLGPEDDFKNVVAEDLGRENLNLVAEVWKLYQDRLTAFDLVDFDDLISMVVTLLSKDAALAETIRRRFAHILVDEYQDVNKGQYLLVKLIAGRSADNISDKVVAEGSAMNSYNSHLLGTQPTMKHDSTRQHPFSSADRNEFHIKEMGKSSPETEEVMAQGVRDLVVIGDPDQSIYGFRGSDNRYFHQFQTDYPDAKKIILQRNYRSTETILKASFQLITHGDNEESGLKNKIFSDINGRERLAILEAASDRAEAVVVGRKIETLVGGLSLFSMDLDKVDSTKEREFSFADFAVLYRTRRQGKIFADKFQEAGIPFQIADKDSLLTHPGIGELVSLLKLLGGGATLQDLFGVLDLLKAGVGKVTGAKLHEWCLDLGLSPAGALERLKLKDIAGIRKNIAENLSRAAEKITELGQGIQGLSAWEALELLARSTDIHTLIQSDETSCRIYDRLVGDAKNNKDDVSCLLDSLSLDNDSDTLWPGAEKVTLMTMHASKGLEFPVVFVTGCEPGLIPFALPAKDPENIAEERRLFYVAMTRARDILCLTYARKRRIYGVTKETGPSVFLQDIEAALKDHEQNRFQGAKKKPRDKQLDLFE